MSTPCHPMRDCTERRLAITIDKNNQTSLRYERYFGRVEKILSFEFEKNLLALP